MWGPRSLALSASAGRYTVGVAFLNDLVAPGCDRNLLVRSLTLTG